MGFLKTKIWEMCRSINQPILGIRSDYIFNGCEHRLFTVNKFLGTSKVHVIVPLYNLHIGN